MQTHTKQIMRPPTPHKRAPEVRPSLLSFPARLPLVQLVAVSYNRRCSNSSERHPCWKKHWICGIGQIDAAEGSLQRFRSVALFCRVLRLTTQVDPRPAW